VIINKCRGGIMQLVELNEKEYRKFTDENKAHFLESYEWGIISEYRGYNVYYL
jgi:lipid II:glycine glycyltransferase (peptidoglycan interpeptide bridge formation enzyme)